MPPIKKANETKKESPMAEYVKNARDLSFIIAVFLYFMGWIYAHYYLEAFSLSTNDADIDIYTFFIYSSNIFIYLFVNDKIILGAAIAIICFLFYWRKTALIVVKLIPSFIFLLFPIVFVISKTIAEHDAKNIKFKPERYLKSIQFIFKDAKKDSTKSAKKSEKYDTLAVYNLTKRNQILYQNHLGTFRLVAANKEEYFVLLVREDTLTEKSYKSYVPIIYSIKRDQVEFCEITK